MNQLQNLVPISSRENWDQVNDLVKQTYHPTSQGSVRCYSNLAQAVLELAQGTGQFLSHKKNVAVFQGATPIFEILTPHFIRDALQVVNVNVDQLPKTLEQAKTWVESIPKDTVYVLFPEDHVVSAEVFPWDFLDQALNEKRIISIRLSHHNHFQDRSDVRPFSVRIQVLDLDHVVGICGSRFKTPPMSVTWAHWDTDYSDNLKTLTDRKIDKKSVQEFEKALAEFQFLKTDSRVFDRAVLSFPNLNADRMVKALEKQKIVASTTSLCSWDSFKMMSGWWLPSPSPEALRGLLVLPAKDLSAQLAQQLANLYSQMQTDQSWIVP